MVDQLITQVVRENYLTRAGEARLTGDWIIYSKIDGHNNYITLGRHEEKDTDLAERVYRHERVDAMTGWNFRQCKLACQKN